METVRKDSDNKVIEGDVEQHRRTKLWSSNLVQCDVVWNNADLLRAIASLCTAIDRGNLRTVSSVVLNIVAFGPRDRIAISPELIRSRLGSIYQRPPRWSTLQHLTLCVTPLSSITDQRTLLTNLPSLVSLHLVQDHLDLGFTPWLAETPALHTLHLTLHADLVGPHCLHPSGTPVSRHTTLIIDSTDQPYYMKEIRPTINPVRLSGTIAALMAPLHISRSISHMRVPPTWWTYLSCVSLPVLELHASAGLRALVCKGIQELRFGLCTITGELPNLRSIFPNTVNTTLQSVTITHGELRTVVPLCDTTLYPKIRLLDVTGIDRTCWHAATAERNAIADTQKNTHSRHTIVRLPIIAAEEWTEQSVVY